MRLAYGRLPSERLQREAMTSPSRAAVLFKFTFAMLLIALAFASTYASSASAFSAADLKNILALGGVVTAAFLLLTLRIVFLARSTAGVNAMLTLGTLASVGTAHLVHTELYLGGHWVVLILLSVAAGVALFVAFRIIDEQRRGGIILSAMVLIGLMIVAEDYKTARTGPVFGDTTNIREISFQETPNLYFVSFDALTQRALLNKHLQLETTDFHDLFEERFRRFPNLFVEATWTMNSLESILSLDASQLRSLRRWKDGRVPGSLFSGQKPSPLFSILRKNGYDITTIYRDLMFGKKKGPYVDNYITIYNHTVCSLLDPGIRDLAFWGYCSRINLEERRWGDLPVELTAAAITKVDVSGGPQFVMAHLNWPGHVERSYRHDDASQFASYSARYLRSNNFAARQLDAIVRHLEENDPGAILLAYGDHGTMVSMGVEFSDDPTFVVQAHYGVLGGVYPREACAAWFDEAEAAQNYMTVLDAVHALLRCLSGGESALAKPRDRTLFFGPAKGQDLSIFEEYLYE